MKNNHLLLFIMAFCITIFTGAIYAYMYHMIDLSLERTVKLQTVVDSNALSKIREQSFLQTYNLTAQKWASLSNYFVEPGRIVNFIESVEDLGKESGSKVTIATIDADNLDNAKVGTEGSLRTHIVTQGTWTEVMRALSLAEVMPYKLSINNVRADSSTEKMSDATKANPAKVIWSLSFDMVVAMRAGTSTAVVIK